MLTFEQVTKSEAIRTYIIRADESLVSLGYTEHSFAHVMHVAETAGYILQTLGYDDRTVEVAKPTVSPSLTLPEPSASR